jgi:uncharacterized membrane protein YfcA
VNVPQAGLLLLASTAAGALNAVAGGGSFLSFPALVFSGIAPVLANATNTVALWPGSIAGAAAYRTRLAPHRQLLGWLIGTSLLGGFLGAELLLHTPQVTFVRLVPWLLLAATVLFAFGGSIAARFRQAQPVTPTAQPFLMFAVLQLVIAVYGGYFGGGIGILMLSALGFMGLRDIHAMNGVKNVLAVLINGTAVIVFMVQGAVVWLPALMMMIGAVLGGFVGARTAQRLDPRLVRGFVIGIGLLMTLYFFLQH